MPVYQYHCENCGYAFDQFQHFTDDALTVCPNCHQERLRKVYSTVGIVFKGKGFYATDHRSPSGQIKSHDHASPDAVEAKAGASASEAPKTETKAADPARSSEATASAA